MLLLNGADPGAKGKARASAGGGACGRVKPPAPGSLAPPNPSNAQHGRTALHAAAEKGHMDVAKLLVGAGADLKATDKARRAAATVPHPRRPLRRRMPAADPLPPAAACVFVCRTCARRCTRRASGGACRLR